MIGSTLSHYRIAKRLGQAGVEEVYLAEHTDLSRQAAIRVLPGAFLAGPERLTRFDRDELQHWR